MGSTLIASSTAWAYHPSISSLTSSLNTWFLIIRYVLPDAVSPGPGT